MKITENSTQVESNPTLPAVGSYGNLMAAGRSFPPFDGFYCGKKIQ